MARSTTTARQIPPSPRSISSFAVSLRRARPCRADRNVHADTADTAVQNVTFSRCIHLNRSASVDSHWVDRPTHQNESAGICSLIQPSRLTSRSAAQQHPATAERGRGSDFSGRSSSPDVCLSVSPVACTVGLKRSRGLPLLLPVALIAFFLRRRYTHCLHKPCPPNGTIDRAYSTLPKTMAVVAQSRF